MAIEYGPRGLIGVITPQANTTVEPEFGILLPPGYATINARLMSEKTSIETRLVDYFAQYESALSQFANAPIRAVAYGCTGASYLAGREREYATLQGIEQRLGVAAITAASAVVDALKQMGAQRIALSSPYPQALTRTSIGYWESHGFEVAAEATATADPAQFHPIYSMSAASAARTLEQLAAQGPVDAVVMLGTGMPTLGPILAANAQAGGPPVLSCMLCLVWRCIQAIAPEEAELERWLSGSDWRGSFERRMGPVDTA
jgi:maleate isomerase